MQDRSEEKIRKNLRAAHNNGYGSNPYGKDMIFVRFFKKVLQFSNFLLYFALKSEIAMSRGAPNPPSAQDRYYFVVRPL
jgi:hypothetical protein